jgi:hypothetical protein
MFVYIYMEYFIYLSSLSPALLLISVKHSVPFLVKNTRTYFILHFGVVDDICTCNSSLKSSPNFIIRVPKTELFVYLPKLLS